MAIGDIAYTASVWILPVLIAITFHEAAHGWVAWKLGDDTAKSLGRVTFNPFRHIDPFGTVLLPALLLLARAPFLFGWAKPVPVRFGRLRKPRRDTILVAAAGPGINLLLGLVSAASLHLVPVLPESFGAWAFNNLENSIIINLVLAVFNLFPLPPLDGGRIAMGLLPLRWAARLAGFERFGLFILIGLLFIMPAIGREMGVDLDMFAWLIVPPVDFLLDVVATLTGLR